MFAISAVEMEHLASDVMVFLMVSSTIDAVSVEVMELTVGIVAVVLLAAKTVLPRLNNALGAKRPKSVVPAISTTVIPNVLLGSLAEEIVHLDS